VYPYDVATCKQQKHKCNEAFFSRIDTERKAYWLGMMYADGNVIHHSYSFQIRLTLTEDDGYLVEEFKRDLEAVHKISIWKSHGYNNSRPLKVLAISSRQMFEDLGRLGCYPRKSLTLKFPTMDQVPDHLIRHFMRGYFDGDGCITFKVVSTLMCPYIQIEGTKEFLESLREWLKTRGVSISFPLNKRHKKRSTNAYNFRAHAKEHIKAIYHLFYDDATFWMKRKRDRFEAWLELEAKKPNAFRSSRRNLSIEQVSDIRQRLSVKESMQSIANRMGCSLSTVFKISKNISYKDCA
jgi:hypothetical protein